MHAESAIPKRPQLHCANSGTTLFADLEIAIHRANAFFQNGANVGLNNAGGFFLTGKWPSSLDKLSKHGATEFAIVVNQNGAIREIQEKDTDHFSRIHIHPLNQRSLTTLLMAWVNEQIKKSSRSSLELPCPMPWDFDPTFAITVQDGHCIGLSILENIKNLPNGVHVLYVAKNHNNPKTEKSSLTTLEKLPHPAKTTQ